METCRVLWLDVKGTSFGMLKEPDKLRERLFHFYKISAEIPNLFRHRLGDYRAYNFSDTLMLTVFSKEQEVNSQALAEIAHELINRYQANGMKVRAFLTTGVEADAPPVPSYSNGSGGDRYKFLFGVNTAVMKGYVADSAHLPGTLFADDMIWKQLGSPKTAAFAIAARGEAFRRDSDSRWVSLSRPAEKITLDEPFYEFYCIRD